jgi:hypothetical protein
MTPPTPDFRTLVDADRKKEMRILYGELVVLGVSLALVALRILMGA